MLVGDVRSLGLGLEGSVLVNITGGHVNQSRHIRH